MDRKAVSILFLVLAIFAPARLSGQDVFVPLIVEGPRISRTAFTNWEIIKLTYTVRWMDGYEPVHTELKPQARNFGVLELDPEFADEAEIKNKRRDKKETYFDITYHLRYMGEKKGEIVVPGQRFTYREVLAGESTVKDFSTEEFKLAYGTVLTSNANEIKEEFEFGSYQKRAMLWRVGAGVTILIGIIGSLVLVLFRPVPAPLTETATGSSVLQASEDKVDPVKVISELQANIIRCNMGAICNGLSDLIRVYVPGVKQGITSKEMAAPIFSISHDWEQKQLLKVHEALCCIEDYLFLGGDAIWDSDKIKHYMSSLPTTIHELRPWSVYWHRHLFNLKQKLTKPLSILKKLAHRKRP